MAKKVLVMVEAENEHEPNVRLLPMDEFGPRLSMQNAKESTGQIPELLRISIHAVFVGDPPLTNRVEGNTDESVSYNAGFVKLVVFHRGADKKFVGHVEAVAVIPAGKE
jgi:hypothetical protein